MNQNPNVRKSLYFALIAFSLVFAGFIFYKGKDKIVIPELKERKGELANAPDWETTQQTVQKLMITLKTKPDDAKTKLLLAKEFIQEGRASGDFTYYNKAALDLINEVLAKDPKNQDALCIKGTVYLSQHRFAEGKEVAENLLKMNPYNSFVYGLLVDANVEMGDYQKAVEMSDKMVSVRPDIRSYSRISYLREIHGDVPGSLEAIKMAVSAGYPGYEDTEWARMVAAHLLEDSGKLDEAEAQYNLALGFRKGYPFATAGLGRIARYRKDYPKAIQQYERAKTAMADASFFEELIDLYRLNNQPEKADEYAKILLNSLLADNISAKKDKDAGHFSDRDIAAVYLKMNEPEKALEYAQTEYDRRPQNIDACETLAWVFYKIGKPEKAAPLMATALRTNSQNPERLMKAGLISVANGQKTEGEALISKAMALKPYMDEELVAAAKKLKP